MVVTPFLFAAGIVMGVAAALMWAWGVRSGQFRDLEKTKDQLFWPEIAGPEGKGDGTPRPAGPTNGKDPSA